MNIEVPRRLGGTVNACRRLSCWVGDESTSVERCSTLPAASVAMKPISTLMRPLETVDTRTGASASASAERSDVTAVPAMGVIAEAMAALVLADALLEKFGGDSLGETRRNHDAYLARVAERLG